VFSVVSKTLLRVAVIAGVVGLGLWGWSNFNPPGQQQPDARMLELARRPLTHVVHHGDLLCVLQVPRLGLTVPVVEGADSDSLLHGAGHVMHTAFPGHHGNAGIAAHRDTCFRPLRFIRPGDDVVITSPDGVYDYVVAGTEIVLPSDGEVLHHTRNRVLTLVTCYPFYYVGHAPKRFIVHAAEPDSLIAS
jgi:LPXTG-site transpeptidase (sortase) family protein